MCFKYAETDNCYDLLITDPRKFLERLKTTDSMDHLIRDVDLDTYEYDGLNIFHCLSRIVGNSEPNNFGDTVDFPSSLGCDSMCKKYNNETHHSVCMYICYDYAYFPV